jgi:hypothetical protein
MRIAVVGSGVGRDGRARRCDVCAGGASLSAWAPFAGAAFGGAALSAGVVDASGSCS